MHKGWLAAYRAMQLAIYFISVPLFGATPQTVPNATAKVALSVASGTGQNNMLR